MGVDHGTARLDILRNDEASQPVDGGARQRNEAFKLELAWIMQV